MDASVGKTALVYLMLLRLASPALSSYFNYGNVTGVSLVGGSGPHEGTVQLVVASNDGSQPPLVTGSMAHLHPPFFTTYIYVYEATAICRTLGYPDVNRVFNGFSPYLADVIEEPSFHIHCRDDATVIGCIADTFDFAYRSAVRCQTDGYLGCFGDEQDARPLATSPCPPGLNSNYSCADRDNMTMESCREYCKTLNGRDVTITYAGVRAGIECTCGVNTTDLGNPSGNIYLDCVSPCSGDRNYSNCGGIHYIAAFNITSEPDEQEATTHAVHSCPDPADTTPADTTTSMEPDGDSSSTKSVGNSVTSEPDGQEATTHAVHPSPDPTDTTPADTTTSEEPDGDSSFSGSTGNSVHNAGEGVRFVAVIFTIMAGVNVYGYE